MHRELSKTQFLKNNLSTVPFGATIYVGMSGGVDSSVVASLLKEKEYNVIGIYLDCWDYNEIGCNSDVERLDALKVATKLGVKFLTWDFRAEYKNRVLSYFLDSYKNGETPNPDVLCNTFIKFGVFVEEVLKRDKSAYIATGHYAKNLILDKKRFIAKGKDLKKDQSYFLYDINRSVLERILFPLGNFNKVEVRKYAEDNGLVVSKKPDSQGVCFTGGINVKDYLIKEIGYKKGDVIDLEGNIIGSHLGCHLYTIGEKYTNINILNPNTKRLYVVDKNVSKNILIVGELYSVKKKEFFVSLSNGFKNIEIKLDLIEKDKPVFIQIRNTGDLNKCTLKFVDKSTLRVTLKSSLTGVSSGQSAVFYQNVKSEWLIVAGGLIKSA